MPGLGSDLVVNLAGNNSKLKSKIAESKGGLSSFASAAKGMLNPVVAGLTAVAGGAIAAGVAVYGLTTRIAGLAAVADQATQTGLSVAFIQRLGYAAGQSGVGFETLMGGIKKLTILIGKGDEKPFANLGISLAELKTLSPEKQFLKVAEAITKLPTAADRATAAVNIFGKAGIDMTGLFAGGMESVVSLIAEAESLGIGISEKAAESIAAADDAMDKMKASFGALLDQITVGVAPAFTLIATKIADMIPPLTKFLDKFNGLADTDKIKAIGDLFSAGMAVAFAGISEAWDTTLDEMIAASLKAAQKMNPANLIGKGVNAILRVEQPKAAPGESKLDAAMRRFGDVVKGINAGGNAQPGQPVGNKPMAENLVTQQMIDDAKAKRAAIAAEDRKALQFGEKVSGKFFDANNEVRDLEKRFKSQQAQTGDMAGLAKGAKDLFGGLWMGIAKAAQKEIANPTMRAGDGLVGDLPPAEVGKAQAPQFAGAMQRGSAEAYSTIVQAMFRGQDPNVKATEKQTVQLVKAMKDTKPKFNLVESFA